MHAEYGRWSNWGLYPEITGTVWSPVNEEESRHLVGSRPALAPRGNGRSYGDASLGRRMVSGMGLAEVFELDRDKGTLRCSAGLLLDEILLRIVPQGFFLPVTPGTRLVSIGGAIGGDIHGKNHHVDGSFSAFVETMTVLTGDGTAVTCSPTKNSDLFWATCGGMGLTGFILEATIRLKPITSAYIRQRSIKCGDLDELFAQFEEHKDATYNVAWIDLMAKGRHQGRSVLLLGEHAEASELKGAMAKAPLRPHGKTRLKVPFFFPGFVLSPFTVKIFNWLYNWKADGSGRPSYVHYGPYFHPLDAVHEWNKIYGRRGFVQYQFVVPLANGRAVMGEVLEELRRNGMVSFLAVLKRFGPGAPDALLSFPAEGYTLALDIPLRKGTLDVLDELDRNVADAGGRIYLVKDARMSASMMAKTYPRLDEFRAIARRYGQGRFRTALSDRLGLLDEPAPAPFFDPNRVLILGAGSGMATALARCYAREGHSLVLAMRDQAAAQALCDGIQAETGASCTPAAFDAEDTGSHAAFYAKLDPRPGIVVCAFGLLPDQATAQDEPGGGLKAIAVNYTGAVSILEEAARDLEQRGEGSIIGISSVAGDRGRASNYFYGSAKAGFTAYLSGLRNRLQASGVHVLTVKPGFVRTAMTEGLPLPAPLTASAEQAAEAIHKAWRKRRNTAYVLGRWRWIMLIIKLLPEGVFKRLKL
ncbi:MAG TPA: SDR family oxidoreductase [Flavobacteriales bacterium]|nr:SDR family oxidoreductase [Flavobacteriales bacterium]